MGRRESRLSALSRSAGSTGGTNNNDNMGGYLGEASLEFSVATSTASADELSLDFSAISSGAGSGTNHSEVFRASSTTSNGDSNKTPRKRQRRPSLVKLMSSKSAAAVIHDLNRLKFSSLGLYGRELELESLHRAYERLETNDKKQVMPDNKRECCSAGQVATDKIEPLRNLLLVKGRSGTGKSAMVKEFRNQVVKKDKNVVFACGKFDQHLSTPYAAFISAFSQLCAEIILQGDPAIRDAILEAIGGTTDYQLLLDLIPNIGELVYEARGYTSDNHQQQSAKEEKESEYDIIKSEKKFKGLLRRFLKAAVSKPKHKLVLFLDDLQWVDPASLGLLEMILTEDTALQEKLLIICSYRDNEVDNQHPFSRTLGNIEEKRKQQVSVKLSIENLSPQSVHGFITELFNTNPEETEELATIAYRRVQGNVFYLIQFLTALRDGGYLKCNLATVKWTWDESSIRKSTVVAGNVLALLMERMKKLPKRLNNILQIAACLGSSFDEVVLAIVDRKLSHSSLLFSSNDYVNDDADPRSKLSDSTASATCDTTATNNPTTTTTTEALESIVEEGLLEALPERRAGSRSYCFAHDQIELAANALLDEDMLPQLKLEIGRILWENKASFDYQSLLFTIVDMWNAGGDMGAGTKEAQLIIDLNFEAGKKALENSAFGASVGYLRRAIRSIPEDKRWNEHYPLSLQLHNLLIKAEYSHGDSEALNIDIRTILGQENRPVLDKMVAYSTMITILSTQQHNHVGAINVAVDLLGQLGTPFQPQLGMLAVVGALIKTKRLLRRIPLEILLSQVELEDKYKSTALDIVRTILTSMYATNPQLMVCTVLKTLRWALKYGISKDTARCLGVFALLEMAMGNTKTATRASKLSIKLAEKQGLMESEYAPITSAYGFVLPWTTSLHECRNHLFEGYDVGMQSGDLEYGYMSVALYCFFCFCSGKPLCELEASMRKYGRHMRTSNQALQLQFLCLTWQMVLNLMGRCDDPLVLSGEAMNQEEMLQSADVDKNPPLRAQLQCYRLQLAVYYKDFKLAGKLIGLASIIAVVNPANPIIWRTALFEGVAAFELARQQKGRKWKCTALKALSKVQKWVDAGNVNCVHILYLLQAEQAAMQRKNKEARILFDKAIVTAARNGFRNDRALASERCAEMYLFIGDEYWATDYLQKAFKTYEEMEAYGKLDHMAARSSSLRPYQIVVGDGTSEEAPDAATLLSYKGSSLGGITSNSSIVIRNDDDP